MSQNPSMVNENVEIEDGEEFITPIEELSSGGQRFPVVSPRPRDRAWAVAFKINVAITVISVRGLEGEGKIELVMSPSPPLVALAIAKRPVPLSHRSL